jgi:hypothetical protein
LGPSLFSPFSSFLLLLSPAIIYQYAFTWCWVFSSLLPLLFLSGLAIFLSVNPSSSPSSCSSPLLFFPCSSSSLLVPSFRGSLNTFYILGAVESKRVVWKVKDGRREGGGRKGRYRVRRMEERGEERKRVRTFFRELSTSTGGVERGEREGRRRGRGKY